MISRIEIDKRGRPLYRLGDQADSHWFDFSVFPPREFSPRSDPAIPLSAAIPESGWEVLSYRPARRLVAAGNCGGADCIRKGYRRGRHEQPLRNLEFARRALQGSGIRTPEVIEIVAEQSCLVMRREPGRRPEISALHVDTFRRMGAGIRHLQAAAAAAELASFTRGDELGVLDERMRRLQRAGGRAPDGWPELRRRLDETAPPRGEFVPAHRDLHDGQWLLGDADPCLLDFDLLCRAEPELDAANFLAHLQLRRLQQPAAVRREDAGACARAFLGATGLGGGSDSTARLRFYQATTCARLALVYLLRPRWAHLAAPLTGRGLRALEGDRDVITQAMP